MYINDLSSFLCKASTSNYAHDDQLYFASKNVKFRIIDSRQEPFNFPKQRRYTKSIKVQKHASGQSKHDKEQSSR